MIHNLRWPALLLDRVGNVRFVNVQALALLGHGTTDNLFSQYFVEDVAGVLHTDRFAAMPTRLATPQAVNVSGWMRLAVARWVTVELRRDRVAGMRFRNLDAEVIALISLRPNASLSANRVSLTSIETKPQALPCTGRHAGDALEHTGERRHAAIT